jgi:hypothetical protein
MLMDRGFLEAIKPLYSPVMGTEAMGPLLYSLICFSRPQRVLEVGAGYTTPFILAHRVIVWVKTGSKMRPTPVIADTKRL